jgi:putative phage-type endonuclease
MNSVQARIKYLQDIQRKLPPQGSEEWLEGRTHQFGGSEVATVLGISPYMKPGEMIEHKIHKKNIDAPACSFGRMFEVVAKVYMRDELGVVIEEFKSIKSPMYPIAYSPDGVVVDEEKDELMLLEIKCPYRRSKLQTIPKYYLPQVMSGMCIMPVDGCHFYQFRFRLCSAWDLDDTPKYNRWLHRDSRKTIPPSDPLFYGYVRFTDEGKFEDVGAGGPDGAIRMCSLPIVRWRMVRLNDYPKRPYRGIVMGFKCFHYTKLHIEPELDYLEKNKAELWKQYGMLAHRKTKDITLPAQTSL